MKNRIVKINEPNHTIPFRNKVIRTPAVFPVTEEEYSYIKVLIKARGITSYEIQEEKEILIKSLPEPSKLEEFESFRDISLEDLISKSNLEK